MGIKKLHNSVIVKPTMVINEGNIAQSFALLKVQTNKNETAIIKNTQPAKITHGMTCG